MTWKKKLGMAVFAILVAALLLTLCLFMPKPAAGPVNGYSSEFIYTIRPYSGGGYDDFQIGTMKDLGFAAVQGLVDLGWQNIEPRDDGWKWASTDASMDKLAQNGMKVIAFIICPKSPSLPWNASIERNDPKFAAEYGEFAFEVTKRYHAHPAWSGIVAVWGGSADVWDHQVHLTDPEVVVPLINAAYDGIKRADPNTIVAGFNFATTATSKQDWEEFHRRAFALSPKFDWYGVQSHAVLTTTLESPGAYSGIQGLANVRKFLDDHGYGDKPLWLNEGGFGFGEDIGGLPETAHAEQVVETFVISRTLPVDLKGWVYFEYFGKNHTGGDGDFGLMSALDQHDPPIPRKAWLGMKTLIKTVKFFDYMLEEKVSGEVNKPTPAFVYRFVQKNDSTSKLWVVFSPRPSAKGQDPVNQSVTIHIAPATQATLIDMLGGTTTLNADGSGNVAVTSTSSPIYLKVGD